MVQSPEQFTGQASNSQKEPFPRLLLIGETCLPSPSQDASQHLQHQLRVSPPSFAISLPITPLHMAASLELARLLSATVQLVSRSEWQQLLTPLPLPQLPPDSTKPH